MAVPVHTRDCSYLIGLACTCGAGDVEVAHEPMSQDARDMTAFLTGYLSVAVSNLTDPNTSPLGQPVQIEHTGPEGIIQLRLASGLQATLIVHVE